MTNDQNAQSAVCASSAVGHSYFVICVLLWWTLAPPAHAAADLSDPNAAVEAGRDALRSQSFTPWYDRKTDTYQPINLPPQRNWNLGWLDWLFGNASGLGELLRFLMWLAIAAMAVWIIVAMLRAWRRNELRQVSESAGVERSGRHARRVEALPVAIDKSETDLLAEARRLAAGGEFKGAIVYLFSHPLVEADAAGGLRLRKGKTNRQYLRELRRSQPQEPRLPGLLERTMLVFERAFFGDHPPAREEFAACLAGAEQYDQLLRASAAGEGAA